jgi:GGDEF domain-containing protein
VILADVRRSDIAGRVGDDTFGVILVGCRGVEGAEAFMSRVRGAFERKLGRRPEKLDLAWGLERLAEAESAESALATVEASLTSEPVGSGAKR